MADERKEEENKDVPMEETEAEAAAKRVFSLDLLTLIKSA